uniref:Uncharacterized protein n=1 Tax=Arundo donax TaxID=35708 RepID=A0A0A8YSL6_ARUDO
MESSSISPSLLQLDQVGVTPGIPTILPEPCCAIICALVELCAPVCIPSFFPSAILYVAYTTYTRRSPTSCDISV